MTYFFITLLALLLGLVFPELAAQLDPYSAWLLGGIFFFSALAISLKDIQYYARDRAMLVMVVILMLVVFPVLVYYLTAALYEPLALPFLLLAAMPSGMTAPLLAEVAGGRQSLALVLTVATSLLAPLSVPFLIKLLAGTAVTVSFWGMFSTLALVIFTPFLLARAAKSWLGSGVIRRLNSFGRPGSLALLGLLLAGIVGEQSGAILETLSISKVLVYLAALTGVFLLLHLLGYWAVFWRSARERVTVSVCLTYMNFTLAIYLADRFFAEPTVVVPVILSIVPWVLLLTPFCLTVKALQWLER